MTTSFDADAGARADQLEIAHFFGEGDGKKTLEALLEGFASRHPDVDVVDQSYSNTAHDLAIKSRILQESPPSVFVEWPGKNLAPYHHADAVMDLTEIWKDNGLEEAFIEGPRDLVSFDGRYFGVPITIHRKNNLFYNVELAEERGIDPSSIDDPREFAEVLHQCDDGSVLGMAQPMKNPWTVLQLWCQGIVGMYGPDVYEAISRGEVQTHRSEINESLRLLDEYASLASEHADFLDMVGANDRFVEGDSVFFHQGDWVAGAYAEIDGFDYGTEWDHVPFPGTEEVYVMGMDSIVAAADAPNPTDARTFMEFVASPAALETVNRVKGSIPPRGDVSLDDYPAFLQDQFRDFKRSRAQVGGQKSLVEPETGIELRTAFSEFIANRDVQATTQAIIDGHR